MACSVRKPHRKVGIARGRDGDSSRHGAVIVSSAVLNQCVSGKRKYKRCSVNTGTARQGRNKQPDGYRIHVNSGWKRRQVLDRLLGQGQGQLRHCGGRRRVASCVTSTATSRVPLRSPAGSPGPSRLLASGLSYNLDSEPVLSFTMNPFPSSLWLAAMEGRSGILHLAGGQLARWSV